MHHTYLNGNVGRLKMIISFASKKLEKQLTDEKQIRKTYGDRGRRLMLRLDLLRAAPTLADVPHTPPVRRHSLTGNWTGHYAVDITANWRLIFRPLSDHPREREPLSSTGIEIVAVAEYH